MARSRSLLRVILVAGLVAGSLDILDPMVFYSIHSHVPAERILQSIASGVFGRAAYSGGWPVALLGLLIHFCIAIAWAALFVIAARYVPVLREHAVPAGLIYGFVVYAVMNFIVLPHSRAVSQPSHIPIVLFHAVCAIVFLVGLPIALINRRLA